MDGSQLQSCPNSSAGSQSGQPPVEDLDFAQRLAKLRAGRLSLMPLPPKRPKVEDDLIAMGPKYEVLLDSVVLYSPDPSSDAFDPISKPDGFVPVVVNPELAKGKRISNTNSSGEALQLPPMTDKQLKGLRFMWNRYEQRKGCILAHYMGVGKTRTAITLVLTLLEQSANQRGKSRPGVKKAIIIVPKNALPGWIEEFSKWCPSSINPGIVSIYSTYSRIRNVEQILDDFDSNNEKHILLLSYNSFKKYAPDMKGFQNPIDLVICDEAHLLKNDATDRSKIMKNFKVFKNEAVWMGVTGTPYQNNLEEYANLVSFFCPQTFENGFSDYKTKFCRPITNYQKRHPILCNYLHSDLLLFRKLIKPVLDYDYINLEIDKHELIICCPLDPQSNDPDTKEYFGLQHILYQECSGGNNMKGLLFYNKLDLLTKLCINPVDAYESYQGREEFLPYKAKLDDLKAMRELKDCIDYFSSKVNLLALMVFETLKSEDEKIIVASNSTVLLDMVYNILNDKYKQKYAMPNLKVVRYDGRTGDGKRETVLNDFNSKDDVRVLLLSCKAGGTALTLTRANHLFLMDPDWNPSNDRQTIGRIYRHGQTRTVYIYRLLCTGTIDEIKFLNQLSKEEMEMFFKPSSTDENGQNEQSTSSPAAARSNGSPVQDHKVLCPFGNNDLTRYFPNTKSHVKDLLDQMQIHVEDKDEVDVEDKDKVDVEDEDEVDVEDEDEVDEEDEDEVDEEDEDEVDEEDEDEVDVDVRIFAEDLQRSNQYQSSDQVPDEIRCVKNLWGNENSQNVISYMFHLRKIGSEVDPIASILFAEEPTDAIQETTKSDVDNIADIADTTIATSGKEVVQNAPNTNGNCEGGDFSVFRVENQDLGITATNSTQP